MPLQLPFTTPERVDWPEAVADAADEGRARAGGRGPEGHREIGNEPRGAWQSCRRANEPMTPSGSIACIEWCDTPDSSSSRSSPRSAGSFARGVEWPGSQSSPLLCRAGTPHHHWHPSVDIEFASATAQTFCINPAAPLHHSLSVQVLIFHLSRASAASSLPACIYS